MPAARSTAALPAASCGSRAACAPTIKPTSAPATTGRICWPTTNIHKQRLPRGDRDGGLDSPSLPSSGIATALRTKRPDGHGGHASWHGELLLRAGEVERLRSGYGCGGRCRRGCRRRRTNRGRSRRRGHYGRGRRIRRHRGLGLHRRGRHHYASFLSRMVPPGLSCWFRQDALVAIASLTAISGLLPWKKPVASLIHPKQCRDRVERLASFGASPWPNSPDTPQPCAQTLQPL